MKIRQSSTYQSSSRWLGLALACGTLTFAVSTQAGKPVPPPPPQPPPPSGPTYRIVSLGTLNGQPVWAAAINAAGCVVGSALKPGNVWTAFTVAPEDSANGPVYFRDTSPKDGRNDLMHELPGLGPTQWSSAGAINGSGLVVGDSLLLNSFGYYDQGTLWLGNSPVNLGYTTDWGNLAYAVNNQGLVTIGPPISFRASCYLVVPEDTNSDGVPDTWFEDHNEDGVNDLLKLIAPVHGYIPWADDWQDTYTPAAINDAGQIILNRWGGPAYRLTPDSADSDGDGNPWYADVNGDGVNDLMVELIGLGSGYVEAIDINATGQMVGQSNGHAVLWDFVGGKQTVRDLGLLSKSVQSMIATAINDAGNIVGDASLQRSRAAFLVYKGTMYDLATRLTNGTGWANLQTRDINNQGCIIGSGDFGGVQQTFVAIPVTQP